jgi:transposase
MPPEAAVVLMDRAYGSLRPMMSRWGVEAVVPPKSNARDPWEYDRGLYRKRNEVERFFHRVATRYDKLASAFSAFVTLGAIILLIKNVNTA